MGLLFPICYHLHTGSSLYRLPLEANTFIPSPFSASFSNIPVWGMLETRNKETGNKTTKPWKSGRKFQGSREPGLPFGGKHVGFYPLLVATLPAESQTGEAVRFLSLRLKKFCSVRKATSLRFLSWLWKKGTLLIPYTTSFLFCGKYTHDTIKAQYSKQGTKKVTFQSGITPEILHCARLWPCQEAVTELVLHLEIIGGGDRNPSLAKS